MSKDHFQPKMELERLQSNKNYKDLCLQAHKRKYLIKLVRSQALETCRGAQLVECPLKDPELVQPC